MRLTALLLLALSGCATCQQHPAVCAAAAAVVSASVALSLDRHDCAAPVHIRRDIK